VLKRSHKNQNIINLLLTLAVIVVINVLSYYIFARIDLTADKRYTLHKSTEQLLSKLKDQLFFKVYLEGDFPPGFRRLHDETLELLDEMRIKSNGKLDYAFINPSALPDEQQRNDLYKQLAQKGLFPTTLEEKGNDESSQKIIFPGAIVTYNSLELPVQLLKDQFGTPPEEMLNNSIRNLEYELASVIKKATTKLPPQIAFLEGQNELNGPALSDIKKTLGKFYGLDSIRIDEKLDVLKRIQLLIVAKPDTAFSEKDKFIIDQYVMNGGKILWCMDATNASMDSLARLPEAMALSKTLNIDDMLFRYGVRINADLIMDMQAVPIPVMTRNYMGNQPVQKMLPWPFFPMLFSTSSHPIVENLNAIKTEFASSMDTINNSGVVKTVLLTSSKYSRAAQVPVRISLDIFDSKPNPKFYNKSYLPVAVLLEGTFTSLYKNRIPAALASDTLIKYKEQSVPNKMIVISDGDILKNTTSKNGQVFPLEYDRYTNQFFGNKNLLLNMVDYLTDDSGLISLRSKQIKLRLLDKNYIQANTFNIQAINVVLPLLLILFLGITKIMFRKKQYARIAKK